MFVGKNIGGIKLALLENLFFYNLAIILNLGEKCLRISLTKENCE